jgi:hypothetical protein
VSLAINRSPRVVCVFWDGVVLNGAFRDIPGDSIGPCVYNPTWLAVDWSGS